MGPTCHRATMNVLCCRMTWRREHPTRMLEGPQPTDLASNLRKHFASSIVFSYSVSRHSHTTGVQHAEKSEVDHEKGVAGRNSCSNVFIPGVAAEHRRPPRSVADAPLFTADGKLVRP